MQCGTPAILQGLLKIVNKFNAIYFGKDSMKPVVHRLSMIFLAVAFTLIIYVNIEAMLALQPAALLACLPACYCVSYPTGLATQRAVLLLKIAKRWLS